MANDFPSADTPWPVQQVLMDLRNPWLRLVGERLQRPDQQAVDYWRVEKADSAIVLPIWREQVVLPPAVYRPGLGQATLDLPGGRVASDQDPTVAAQSILQRELNIDAPSLVALKRINIEGWPVNSSFSNQRLFGFRATLTNDDHPFPPGSQHCPFTPAGLRDLLQRIACLQCRAVILEVLLPMEPSQAADFEP